MPTSLAGHIRNAGGLANQADLARAWGISRARVALLVRDETFPAPVGMVGGSPVWALGAANDWRERQKTRRRGPRKAAPIA